MASIDIGDRGETVVRMNAPDAAIVWDDTEKRWHIIFQNLASGALVPTHIAAMVYCATMLMDPAKCAALEEEFGKDTRS